MRIFMLIKWLHNSGAPKMFMWLANTFAKRGHDVMVCTYHNHYEGMLSPLVKHVDFTDEERGFWGRIKRIRGIVKEFDADVSISFLLDANVYNMFACYRLRTKSIVCERNDPFKPHYWKLKFWKPWFRLADGAVFQLPKVAEYYSCIKGETVVIPNPIIERPHERCLPFSEREKIIVAHGRIDIEQKRQDLLIMAFALLHHVFPDYILSIYGSGNDKDVAKVKDLVSQLKLSSSVRLEGETKNPLEAIKNARVWVMTSDFEGIPNALIEAMSIGLPCVATDCSPGGARLLIDNEKNGFVVPRGDYRAVYQKMRYLIEHTDEAEKMGMEALHIAERFVPEDIAKQWESYCKKIHGNPPS